MCNSLANVNNGARLITLSILSGGAAMVTFVAITLVKAATADGVSVAEAAFRNGPAFIKFANVAMITASVLFVTECADMAMRQKDANRMSKLMILRYVASSACIVAMFVFNLRFAKPMQKLMPEIKTNEEAHAQFDKLHKGSRIVFGVGILFAFVSLVIPVAVSVAKPTGE